MLLIITGYSDRQPEPALPGDRAPRFCQQQGSGRRPEAGDDILLFSVHF